VNTVIDNFKHIFGLCGSTSSSKFRCANHDWKAITVRTPKFSEILGKTIENQSKLEKALII